MTLALIYKFMDELDEQSVQMGGRRSFFVKDPGGAPKASSPWRNFEAS